MVPDIVTYIIKDLNKNENAGDCPYCGTKNAEDKTNCINCGAVINLSWLD